MIREDFHVHSCFSDGKHSPAEIAEAALDRGLARLGFSDHGYAPYDLECCVPRERLGEYREAVAAVRERCRGRIEIFCGIEQDAFAGAPEAAYDYVIGSVHYVYADGEYLAVDDTPERLRAAAEEHFGGDLLALVEAYYETVGEVLARTGCEIVGHFDLVTKFNEAYPWIDTAHPRYRRAWQAAAERLLREGARWFEINTGAMARGWRSSPYPAQEIVLFLAERGARFVLSGDSHSAENLCFAFDEVEAGLSAMGVRAERLEL